MDAPSEPVLDSLGDLDGVQSLSFEDGFDIGNSLESCFVNELYNDSLCLKFTGFYLLICL